MSGQVHSLIEDDVMQSGHLTQHLGHRQLHSEERQKWLFSERLKSGLISTTMMEFSTTV
jgi:hypothetical protein